ncbi:hypothetical protein HanXRQr2_Chr08g0361491 [Helianthus annuus]|uniref:Uncharacterized protein n=1 Tax=Helianthus annuus TaxID=4232 RepID=A0A251U8Q0_HELAN|nr:hypothetical protein HanXRQr2_Chr08g0361491 [Helianthus annuus]KAJ0903419.1 hypothetical protein HanPSC8_Chr08g0348811 [Helianthus annuus]
MSHLIPIRLPPSLSLSLSLGDSETLSIPTTRQSSVFQTCAGFVNDGGCRWKMTTLVGGQIGMILWMRMQMLVGMSPLFQAIRQLDKKMEQARKVT